VFVASRQSPLLSSLGDSMKVGRLPSSGITRLHRYYSPLRLLARLAQISVALILNHRGHHPRRTRSPALPSAASLTCRPDDPGEPICSFSVSPHRWQRPSPLDHRVGTLNQQVTRLYGFPGGTACEFAILLTEVFSIHLVLRVTPQNRIFANGVYR